MKPARTPSDLSCRPPSSRLIQQQELHFAPPLYRADGFALPTAEGDVFLVNVPVSGFQLADEPAFRMSAVTEQYPLAHIEAQYGKEQGIFAKSSEQLVAHRQILAEQGFGFRLRHVVGEVLVRQPAMPVAVVGVIGTVVHSLKLMSSLS